MLQNAQGSLTNLQRDGFALLRHVVEEREIGALIDEFGELGMGSPAAGMRDLLRRCPAANKFATSPPLLELVSSILGNNARPVKAILFDKTPTANWYVTWHQDLTIAVKKRVDVAGFGPWSEKGGIPHVQPPASVLEKMLALRIHLDDCLEENGPIKFISGSHSGGILTATEIDSWKKEHEEICCVANRGDVIAMRPLIVHSSSKSKVPGYRRVLHIEYAAEGLPGGLEWAEGNELDDIPVRNQ